MNFDNKYGNNSEIKNKILYEYHEYMYNYFMNNPNKHNLDFVYAGMACIMNAFDDISINNKLYNYLKNNERILTAEEFRDNFNVNDFLLGIVIALPFGAEFNNNENDEHENLLLENLANDETFRDCIKYKRIDEERFKIIIKPTKLLKILDENIDFNFNDDNNMNK